MNGELKNMSLKQIKTMMKPNKAVALDCNQKTIRLHDYVKVIAGPTEGNQGEIHYVHQSSIFVVSREARRILVSKSQDVMRAVPGCQQEDRPPEKVCIYDYLLVKY